MEDHSLLLLMSTVSATIFVFIFLFGSQTSKSAKLPPGPRPFPIIGNLLELGSQPHQALANLSKIYGPIMTLKLGNRTTIVISSAEAAKEVLNKNYQVFSNRTIPDALRALDHHILSVAWMAPSAQWRVLRKACATKLFSSQQLDFSHLVRQTKVKELLNFVTNFARRVRLWILDLFVAGIDTTSSTMEWVMAELLRSPEKLAKARQELQQVLNEGEQLEESQLSKLPFLEAAVKETFRLHPPAPFLVPRKAEDDVHLSGFIVPKDAQILVNAWAIGRDSSSWENPNQFMPERFLGSNIDFKGHDYELIPFGAGRRICPGLPLASRIVPFVIASLLHNYDWKLADGLKSEDMDMSEHYGFTLHKLQSLRTIPIKG